VLAYPVEPLYHLELVHPLLVAILKELENKYIPTITRKQMGRSKNNIPVDKNTREK
jgi:hypothetical protein